MLASLSHTRGTLLFFIAGISLFGFPLLANDKGPHTTPEQGLSEDEFYGYTIIKFILGLAQKAPDDAFILSIDGFEHEMQLNSQDPEQIIVDSDLDHLTDQIETLKTSMSAGTCPFESGFLKEPRIKLYRRALSWTGCYFLTSDITDKLKDFFYLECAKRTILL